MSRVLALDAHVDFRVGKEDIPHPLMMDFERSIGEPHGQIADFRFPLEDGRCIHARDMGKWWTVHWDRVHPTPEKWWDHLTQDAPMWALLVLVIGVLLILSFVDWAVSQLNGNGAANGGSQ